MDIIVGEQSFIIKRGKQGAKPLVGYPYTRKWNAERGAIATKRALKKCLVEMHPKRGVIMIVNAMGYPLAEATYNRPHALKKAYNDLMNELSGTTSIQIEYQR